jgi:hypothetical protein
MFNTKVVHNFKIYSFVIEHNSKFKALLQFIHINVYIGSIVPAFWIPKRLYAKKVLNTKNAQNFKTKSFAVQQKLKFKGLYNGKNTFKSKVLQQKKLIQKNKNYNRINFKIQSTFAKRLHKCLHVIRCTYNLDTKMFSN